MAPLPPETTARFWLDYEVNNVPHSMQVRFNPLAAPLPDVADTLAAFLGFVQAALPDEWLVTGARQAAANSTISLPYDLTGTELLGFAGTSTNNLAPVDIPRELVYVGRSPTTGRRVRLSLYGALITTPANYRFGPGETVFASAEVFALLNAGSAGGIFRTIDGSQATWYSYVNVNYNSYWETERRSSS